MTSAYSRRVEKTKKTHAPAHTSIACVMMKMTLTTMEMVVKRMILVLVKL